MIIVPAMAAVFVVSRYSLSLRIAECFFPLLYPGFWNLGHSDFGGIAAVGLSLPNCGARASNNNIQVAGRDLMSGYKRGVMRRNLVRGVFKTTAAESLVR